MMKYFFCFFLFFYFEVSAQEVSFLPLVFSDPGDNAGSAIAATNYGILEATEKKLNESYAELVKQRRRSARFFSGKVLDIPINKNVLSLRNRYEELLKMNSRLSNIHYSKKKRNTLRLTLINVLINNIESTISNAPILSKYGDALSFYENLSTNSEKLHAIMNNVEDDIESSFFNGKLVTNILKNR